MKRGGCEDWDETRRTSFPPDFTKSGAAEPTWDIFELIGNFGRTILGVVEAEE